MVPTGPIPHLVVAQARLALATMNALLDPVLGFRDPRHFVHRCIDRTSVNEVIIVFVTAIALQFTRDKHPLFRTRRRAQFRRYPTCHRLDDQRPFFAIADFESLPRRRTN